MNFNLTLIMQAVAFTAFIWFCARFIWPPLMRAIETRQKQIADGLAAGEQGRKELASAEKRDARDAGRSEVAVGGDRRDRREVQGRDDRAGEGRGQGRGRPHHRRREGRDRAGGRAREGAAARLGRRPRRRRRDADPEEGRRPQGARASCSRS